jgi:Kef-type K+ transport system membrane component KefB
VPRVQPTAKNATATILGLICLVIARQAHAADAAAPAATSSNSLFAIKVIGGLIALVVLAYLGGHKRVVKFQEQLGISSAIAAGLPFVILGLVASHPDIAILSGDVLERLRPLLHFGLGWLGFIIGAQLDIRVLDRVPKGTAYIILVEAAAPFAATATACGAIMLTYGMTLDDPTFWRDLVVLGAAAAMTAPRKFRGFANRGWSEGKGVDILIAQLDEIVGVIGLLFITAYFRDDTANIAWHLPSTAWVFVAAGLGVSIGVLIFVMVRVPSSNAEFLAVVIGAIAFASGLAGYLHLSPLVICFLAGVLVVNFPNDQRDAVFRILQHLERPVHQLFLIIAGAIWTVGDWRGWLLVPAFVIARSIGKFVGVFAARKTIGMEMPRGFVDGRRLVSPLSSLSIALVISIESLYRDQGIAWITTAVIGSAFFIEIVVQFTGGNQEQAMTTSLTGAPIDELDHAAPMPTIGHESGPSSQPIVHSKPVHSAAIARPALPAHIEDDDL